MKMLTINKDKICDFLSQNGIEGFNAEPYLDSAGIPTIGCGTTAYPNGKRVTLKDIPISRDTALDYLWSYVEKGIELLNNLITPTLNEDKTTAILSLSYNIGFTDFKSSTLCKLINNNSTDSIIITNAFMMWNKVRNPITKQLVFSKGLNNK